MRLLSCCLHANHSDHNYIIFTSIVIIIIITIIIMSMSNVMVPILVIVIDTRIVLEKDDISSSSVTITSKSRPSSTERNIIFSARCSWQIICVINMKSHRDVAYKISERPINKVGWVEIMDIKQRCKQYSPKLRMSNSRWTLRTFAVGHCLRIVCPKLWWVEIMAWWWWKQWSERCTLCSKRHAMYCSIFHVSQSNYVWWSI